MIISILLKYNPSLLINGDYNNNIFFLHHKLTFDPLSLNDQNSYNMYNPPVFGLIVIALCASEAAEACNDGKQTDEYGPISDFSAI